MKGKQVEWIGSRLGVFRNSAQASPTAVYPLDVTEWMW